MRTREEIKKDVLDHHRRWVKESFWSEFSLTDQRDIILDIYCHLLAAGVVGLLTFGHPPSEERIATLKKIAHEHLLNDAEKLMRLFAHEEGGLN